jgi:hypothetical protein
VVHAEGFLGLYRGLLVSALEITPYLAISLGGYEYLKSVLKAADLDTPAAKLSCAWGSGFCGSLFCFPIDTVKRRLMLDGAPGFRGSHAGATLVRAKSGGGAAAAGGRSGGAVSTAGHDTIAGGAKGTVGSARGAATYVASLYASGGVRVFYRGCLVSSVSFMIMHHALMFDIFA